MSKDAMNYRRTTIRESPKKTLERLQRTYYFHNMEKTVGDMINECDVCQKSKTERDKPYGQLKPLSPPRKPWSSVAWDFIGLLPKSRDPIRKANHDAMLIIVNKLAKYAYFMPVRTTATAEELAHLLLEEVVAVYIIPPSNGRRTERMNQTLEQYLRYYLNYQRDN